LARIDVLCLDKTGTITDGSMEIEGVIPLFSAEAGEIEKDIQFYADALDDENPTFLSIREMYGSGEEKEADLIIPFSSHNKWSLAYYKEKGSLILGAAEFILKEKVSLLKEQIDEYAMKDIGYSFLQNQLNRLWRGIFLRK
jgi:cation-transporting ATPase E